MGSLGEDEVKKKKKTTSPTPPLVLPWKTKFVVAAIAFATDAVRSTDGTLKRRIANVLDAKSAADVRRGVSSHDVHVDPKRNLWFRVYVPTNATATRLPVIVFFHGGGFAFLSPASRYYHAACRRFALRTPALVVSVGYRLSPEHRFPAPYDDGVDVLRFLDEAEEGPVHMDAADLSRCFLAGDSAGANIAHHVARRWCGCVTRRRLTVAGVIAIQPFFGGEGRVESELRLCGAPLVNVERTDWLWRAFLPEGEDRDHEACNVFGPRASDVELEDGFPSKVMVVVGGFDPLQDWQRSYVEGLKKRGREVTLVEYPNAIHAFYLFSELPETSLLITQVRAFVQSFSSSSSPTTVTDTTPIPTRL